MAAEAIFHKQHPDAPQIKQASFRRTWMDSTQNKHAYHCLPLTLANTSGWVIELEEETKVYWDGTSLPKILSGNATAITPGIIGFNLGWVIEAPDYDISYGPVPNWFDLDARCLSALVDGCWPDPVQANWLLPAEKEITFKQGMPIVFITLQKKYVMEEMHWETNNQYLDKEHQATRLAYQKAKQSKLKENPWTGWTKGIKTLRGSLPKLPTIS